MAQLAALDGKVQLTVKGSYDEDRAAARGRRAARRPSRSCASGCAACRRRRATTSGSGSASSSPPRWSATASATRPGCSSGWSRSPWRRAARRRAASRPRSTRRSWSSAAGSPSSAGRRAAAEELTGGSSCACSGRCRRTASPARRGARMGLISAPAQAPARAGPGTVWIAERIQAQAEAEYYDEGAIQAQLREIDAARQAGTIDDAEADGGRGRAARTAAGGHGHDEREDDAPTEQRMSARDLALGRKAHGQGPDGLRARDRQRAAVGRRDLARLRRGLRARARSRTPPT